MGLNIIALRSPPRGIIMALLWWKLIQKHSPKNVTKDTDAVRVFGRNVAGHCSAINPHSFAVLNEVSIIVGDKVLKSSLGRVRGDCKAFKNTKHTSILPLN